MCRRALFLFHAILSTAALTAAPEGFSVAAGSAEKWQGEMPANYLLSFDYRSSGKDGVAKVTHNGKELFANAAGEAFQSARIAVNGETGIHSVWLDGKPITEEKPLPATTRDGGVIWQSDAKDGYDLGGDFTIATKFLSNADGTLIAKCAPEGKWKPNHKALFIEGGKLVYDIGFVGAMGSKKKVADGKWHHAVLVNGSGKARLFVDGKLVAEKKDFSTRDTPDSVLRIGAGAEDFGGNFPGEI